MFNTDLNFSSISEGKLYNPHTLFAGNALSTKYERFFKEARIIIVNYKFITIVYTLYLSVLGKQDLNSSLFQQTLLCFL